MNLPEIMLAVAGAIGVVLAGFGIYLVRFHIRFMRKYK